MRPRTRHLLLGCVGMAVMGGASAGVVAFIAEEPTWDRVRLVLAVGLVLAICGVVARLCWPPIITDDEDDF